MKKIISLCLVLVLAVAAIFVFPTAAADDKLVVTADGKNAKTYYVGDEIVFFVGLNAGSTAILNGECYLYYDEAYLTPVAYEQPNFQNDPTIEGYSFPSTIQKSSPVLNLDVPGKISYNFTATKKVGTFKDTSKLFARFRFKVKKSGSTDITHYIKHMVDANENRIYTGYEPNPAVAPVVETKTMLAHYWVGDIDGSGTVNAKDATIIKRYSAGWEKFKDSVKYLEVCDVDGNGTVNAKDATIVKRYSAGWEKFKDYCYEVDN